MKNLYVLLFFLSGLILFTGNSQAQELSLIPYPLNVKIESGSFVINEKTKIVVADMNKFSNEATYLQELLKSAIGKNIPIVKSGSKNVIEIRYSSQPEKAEAYILNVNPEKIEIIASDGHGAFNALQTLRQLLPANIESASYNVPASASIPSLRIEDSPAFDWRGMHLDVSRHFFTLDYLKKHIDRLSLYKFNKLHLHLTDDQGWRLEIKKYPKLTNEGAWRTFNNQDSACIKKAEENPNFKIDPRFIHEKDGKTVYGGFYTQEEMKDLIAYAQSKHIEIIPEIDVPGHMMAAINAYPYLIEGEKSEWGELFSTPVCACKEEAYIFTKDVLQEVIDLFPSKYIHIGADEVDKTSWKNSELCKEFMKANNIEDVNKLQSHFVHEMQEFVEAHGKKIIAWDEILEGGTNPSVTVMYWRGWEKDAPKKAVMGNSEVIMTPTNPLYFDYVNNNISVNNVYHMEVIPSNVPADKAHLIKGAQANLWTEMIPTEQQAEFQMYPRMIALAERVWTDNTSRFDDFSQRLLKQYPRLDAMGVNYRLPDIEGFAQENVFIGSTDFFVQSPLPDMIIHYTLDGSIPTVNSAKLLQPLVISQPTTLKMALFSSSGVRGEIYTLNFKPSTLKKAVSIENLSQGLRCDFFDKYYKKTSEIQGTPDETFVVNNIKAPKESNSFGLKFSGYIDVPETGTYSFFFNCDDGGVLYIAGETVVDNDGQHSAVMKSGQIALEKGLHPFQLDFLEAGGGYTLKLQYSINGGSIQDIPDNWFKY